MTIFVILVHQAPPFYCLFMSVPQHLYWFAPYNLTCPSTRYRGKLPLEHLQQHYSISADFFYPEATVWAYARLFWLVLKMRFFGPKEAIIVVQKICTHRRYARFLRWLVGRGWHPSWYDLDDAEYYRHPTKSLHHFLTHCDVIWVGSKALATYAQRFNDQVYLNTSPVPQQARCKASRGTPFTVGWVGDTGDGRAASKDFAHRKSLLELLMPALQQLDFPLRLVLIGVKQAADRQLFEAALTAHPQIELVMPTGLNWQQDDWLYDAMLAFDVGVSPLVDHPFNGAKSAFKAKQYLACGVPTVGSDVGENGTFIHHGQNGFLGQRIEELADGLRRVYHLSENDYQQFSKAAKNSASHYTVAAYVKRWWMFWTKENPTQKLQPRKTTYTPKPSTNQG